MERLLQLSLRLEKAKEAELAEAQVAMAEAAGRLRAVQDLEDVRRAELARKQGQGLAPREWAGYAAFLAYVGEREAVLATDLVTLQQEAEARRQALLEMRRERKALETLRSRAKERHREAEEREERMQLDEVAVGRFAREGAVNGPHAGA